MGACERFLSVEITKSPMLNLLVVASFHDYEYRIDSDI